MLVLSPVHMCVESFCTDLMCLFVNSINSLKIQLCTTTIIYKYFLIPPHSAYVNIRLKHVVKIKKSIFYYLNMNFHVLMNNPKYSNYDVHNVSGSKHLFPFSSKTKKLKLHLFNLFWYKGPGHFVIYY